MKTKKITRTLLLLLSIVLFTTSCSNDDDNSSDLKQTTFTYDFNNGQAVADFPYDGMHSDDFMAEMSLEEQNDGSTMITVTLMNTMEGETYAVHAHDAADPSTTPNNTPYNETPNADLFVKMVEGNGSTVTVSQTTMMSYEEVTENYEGFFVIHDPLQAINTADPSTYIVLGSFARTQPETDFESSTFTYDFNTGQLSQDFAYDGTHPNDLSAMLKIRELAGGKSRVSVMLDNTLNGETYMVHAHDFADPSTTPNGTPYDETPNANVLVTTVAGGSMGMNSQISTMSYENLVNDYGAFFVVHDPLQPINTADPTTYVILGVFAE